MRRALIAIGCDDYGNLNPLGGAVKDAERIFDALMRPEVGDYDLESSTILRSPTLQDVRDALTAVLFDKSQLDALTIFFAGHGAMSAGSFYMALRDTRLDALSATALSLADLLRMIAEATPTQSHVIIDACQAGGLIADLNVILKSEVIGRSGTPGLSLLATAAADEKAYEEDGEGVGTTALLDCILGKTFLQDSQPTLDLVEIGRSVSKRVQEAGGQSPVVWGLNLIGPSSFCRNPHAGSGDAPLRSVLTAWSDPETEPTLRTSMERLWEPYVTVSTRWNPRTFVDQLAPILAEIAGKPAMLASLSQRVADAFGVRAAESTDRFREIEVRAACVVALLPHSESTDVRAFLDQTSRELANSVMAALQEIETALQEDRFTLLNGGLSELYFLPLRLTRILGWAGFVAHQRLQSEANLEEISELLKSLMALFLEHYGLSLVAMSDAQAPPLALAITSVAELGLRDEAEQLLGHLFTSFVSCEGRPARADIDPKKILTYLNAREHRLLRTTLDLVAQPTELGSVLIRSAHLLGVDEMFDEVLHELDHLALNAFIATDFRQFGDDMITDGGNATYMIGQDIWTVAELEAHWPTVPTPDQASVALAAMLGSMIFPDRTPWFVYPQSSPTIALPE